MSILPLILLLGLKLWNRNHNKLHLFSKLDAIEIGNCLKFSSHRLITEGRSGSHFHSHIRTPFRESHTFSAKRFVLILFTDALIDFIFNPQNSVPISIFNSCKLLYFTLRHIPSIFNTFNNLSWFYNYYNMVYYNN